MKTMLLIGHKHVEFKAAKHVIIAGNLCDQANPLRVIGRITRCYSISEPPVCPRCHSPIRQEGAPPGVVLHYCTACSTEWTSAVTDACTAGQPPHTLQLTD